MNVASICASICLANLVDGKFRVPCEDHLFRDVTD